MNDASAIVGSPQRCVIEPPMLGIVYAGAASHTALFVDGAGPGVRVVKHATTARTLPQSEISSESAKGTAAATRTPRALTHPQGASPTGRRASPCDMASARTLQLRFRVALGYPVPGYSLKRSALWPPVAASEVREKSRSRP